MALYANPLAPLIGLKLLAPAGELSHWYCAPKFEASAITVLPERHKDAGEAFAITGLGGLMIVKELALLTGKSPADNSTDEANPQAL